MSFFFKVQINLSSKRRGLRRVPDITAEQVGDIAPSQLTRRRLLEQVMSIFDPLGLLSPFLLQAKLYLRETWIEKLGWDDAVSSDMVAKWITFFSQLFLIESLKFPRCMTPVEAIGNPELIILSDGSETAYGCAAYIRWELEDGKFWCRLLMSKCRIAPVNRISIPQMELNGAVLSKRIRKVIEQESRFSFSKILQLIDSTTVLGMLHRLSTRFKVYEGVRISETQSVADGDMSCWGLLKLNIADWATRSHSPYNLDSESVWYRGPDFLYLPFENWEVQFDPPIDVGGLPGEKVGVHVCQVYKQLFAESYKRVSSIVTVQKAMMIAVKDQRLFLPELLTSLTCLVNTPNERPIGNLPSTDSVLSIVTPKTLLLGRSTEKNPENYEELSSVSLYSRLKLVKAVESQFWKQWVELYVPTLIKHQKWKEEQRDLKVGDVVLILETSTSNFKEHFRLARVKEVFYGDDGRVRRAKVVLKNFRVGEKYYGCPDTILERSVQKLVLLLPVEE